MTASAEPGSRRRCRIQRKDRGPATVAMGICLLGMAVYGLAFRPLFLSQGADIDESIALQQQQQQQHHENSASSWTSRRLLQHQHSHNVCTPRSVETYPPDLFTLEQKQQGAILIHILVSVWLFAALAVVCNDYFLASMEVLCDAMNLKPDVAGATFMAGSSSAPELLTSVIGVFFAESDVGVSTIVGSAVFNILMIVSMCGLLSTHLVYLSWWPMFRDCSFYCLSVVALVIVINDGWVTWYESTILFGMYLLYILLMFFNERLDSAVSRRYPSLGTGAAYKMLVGSKSVAIDEERVAILGNGATHDQENGGGLYTDVPLVSVSLSGGDDGPESPFLVPQGLLKRTCWLFMMPWKVAFYLTIPDCRHGGIWRRLFCLTLIASVIWISIMSYLMVWMVCATGDALGIPDTVMGLTLLAAGTSVPDCMAAVFVSKGGLGDMAVSNSIGSNVFNILVCLGLPWMISTVFVYPGSSVIINSAGLTYSSITLFSTIVFLFAIVYFNKMKLDLKLGITCLVVYLIVITFSCLYETNVFGQLNPPPCPRTRL